MLINRTDKQHMYEDFRLFGIIETELRRVGQLIKSNVEGYTLRSSKNISTIYNIILELTQIRAFNV